MNPLLALVARVRREPIVVSGLLTSVAAVLASVDSWKAAVPALVSWAMRQYVTPSSSAPSALQITQHVYSDRPLRASGH